MAVEMLANKNVLVVGATGGIGSEATRLIKNGQANVFITGRDEQKLSQIAKANHIPESQAFSLDITDAQAVAKLADTIHGQIGQLDILINAAGIGYLNSFEKTEAEVFSQLIDVNLKGAFHLMRYFLPPMKEAKKGLVINIPGVLGRAPMAGAAAYSASKYGLNGMVKSIREELKRTEVRITNLYLGGVDSDFWDNIDMRVNRDKFINAKEAGRAVWFLCQQPTSGVVSEMVIQPFNHQVI
ncbi:MAG: SDR family oxidoreductase [Lewinellaceae bacterium]|nr:SDR family oxidoreductase [Lewinellaceae bacterium]